MPRPSHQQSKPKCPSCNGDLYRVPRHFLDLVLSKFVPVRRYRCFSVACCWEGTQRCGPDTQSADESQRRYIL